MRSRKALMNTATGLLYEAVLMVCSFILPRLILRVFGSDYNGITSSIAQFLGYVTLLKAGIGGVTKAALYKSLAAGDEYSTSGVVNATSAFLKKAALIFAATLIGFAALYPMFVQNNFDWLFTFSLVLIIGAGTFVQYFFGLTYQLLLYADQRQSVVNLVNIVTTVVSTAISALLIRLGATIHIVKLAGAVVFIFNPLFIKYYAQRYYRIDRTVSPDNEAIKDRWDCFGLQIANFINNNTDIVVLTICTDIFEVSVYSVYHMVTSGLRKILSTFVNGFGSAFGNMLAKKEKDALQNNMLVFEQIVFSLTTFLFSVCMVMITSFAGVYTKGITDVNYIRYVFGYLSTIAITFTCFRVPYQALVEAAGHFRQTRNGSFIEAALNIVISVAAVFRYGLIGVTLGTLVAAAFRTVQYSIYASRNILQRSCWHVAKRLLLSSLVFVIVGAAEYVIPFPEVKGYLSWTIHACVISVIALLSVASVELVFYRKVIKLTMTRMKNGIRRKRRIV